MFKVTNKMKDVRKFRDQKLGKDIHVDPKKYVLTNSPPEESEVWKVEKAEEKPKAVEKKKKKINGGDDQ